MGRKTERGQRKPPRMPLGLSRSFPFFSLGALSHVSVLSRCCCSETGDLEGKLLRWRPRSMSPPKSQLEIRSSLFQRKDASKHRSLRMTALMAHLANVGSQDLQMATI